MTRPVTPAGSVNAPGHATTEASGGARPAAPSRALVPAGPAATHPREGRPDTSPGDSVFAAQLLGQTGRKRGLKGGLPVLDEAKAAYLETEWSGPSDRRLAAGKMTRTDI